MTKKDFIAIAEILRSARSCAYNCSVEDIHNHYVDLFVRYLPATNPNFDRDRFVEAATN